MQKIFGKRYYCFKLMEIVYIFICFANQIFSVYHFYYFFHFIYVLFVLHWIALLELYLYLLIVDQYVLRFVKLQLVFFLIFSFFRLFFELNAICRSSFLHGVFIISQCVGFWLTSFGTAKYDFVIKAIEISNFIPLINCPATLD